MGVMWGLLYMAPAFLCPKQKNVYTSYLEVVIPGMLCLANMERSAAVAICERHNGAGFNGEDGGMYRG